MQDRRQARSGRNGVLMGRCSVAISAGVRKKVVQLLHVQLPLVRGELHEPHGLPRVRKLEPDGRAADDSGEGGVCGLQSVPSSLRSFCDNHDCWAVHGRVGVLLLLGRLRWHSSGVVHLRNLCFRRLHRLLTSPPAAVALLESVTYSTLKGGGGARDEVFGDGAGGLGIGRLSVHMLGV